MDNLDYIDDYFSGANTNEQIKLFEQKIMSDPGFAEDVAFYTSATGTLKEQATEQKKVRFKEIYLAQKVMPAKVIPIKSIWRYMAAASVVAAVIGLTLFFTTGKTSPKQLADKYIIQNFAAMQGISMGTKKDSLQNGLDLYNHGKLTAALVQFKSMVKNDSTDAVAKKYAGIICLRFENYDEALQYFSSLENDASLYINPGKFYKALTLMERNKTGDKDAAKVLLHDVVDKNLEGKDFAVGWLKKL